MSSTQTIEFICYPFGMVMPNRSWSAASAEGYRFGFNGQEKESDVNENNFLTTAPYWEYDTRIGRRWNLDPKPNPSTSSYSTLANNPIVYKDVLGDTISGDLGAYKQVKNYVTNSISTIDQNINNVIIQINSRETAGKGTKSLKRKLNKLETLKGSYQEVLNEFTTLEQSSQVYNIITDGSSVDLPPNAGGLTEFNNQTGYVDIKIGTTMSFIESLPHELKHAFQFQTQKLSLGWNGGGGVLYDLQDEVEAYRRSKLFGLYAGENIDANWVIDRGYSASLSSMQITWQTPVGQYPGAVTYGEAIGSSIIRNAIHSKPPREVVIGWWIYEQTGYDVLFQRQDRL